MNLKKLGNTSEEAKIWRLEQAINSAIGIKEIDFQQSFNRNLFFLRTKSENLKIEFIYFPFHQIESPDKKDGVCVNSLTEN